MTKPLYHRWGRLLRVVRDGESLFEETCKRCGVIRRQFKEWTMRYRQGQPQSATMRTVFRFRRVGEEVWEEERPACHERSYGEGED